jgi:hypothetical protein
MRSWVALCSLCGLLLGAGSARAGYVKTVTTPYPGVTHTVYVDASVPLRLHVVAVDVSSQEIHLSATLPNDRGQTVSDFANCKRGTAGCTPSDIAINGDLFTPSGYVPAGLAIGGTEAWPDAAADNATEGWFAFGRPADVNAVQLSAPSQVEQPPAMLAAEGAVGGRALLVQSGMAMSGYDGADPTEPFRQAPRTAVGLDAGAHALYLVVVDGDQQASLGMTAEQLAWFMSTQLAVSDAIELDGGGSSTLYVRKEGGVVNAPSSGVQRPVANHLGISYGAQVHFSVVGQVYNSSFGDMNKLINNATVTVDGQVATWPAANNHTLYHVDNVTPHYVCAHASAPGFRSGTQCREITVQDVQSQGSTQYLSLVLYPGSDPPPDMAAPPDMAEPPGPSGSFDLSLPAAGDDAGPGHGVKGGGCDFAAGGAGASGVVLLIVLCLGAASTFRRRRA